MTDTQSHQRPAFVDVAFPRPVRRQFTYSVPGEWQGIVQTGTRVQAPLAGHEALGVVVALRFDRPADGGRLLALSGLIDPDWPLPPDLLDLTRWIAEYYMCSWGEALGAASGGVKAPGALAYRLRPIDAAHTRTSAVSLTPAERRILENLSASRSATVAQLLKRGITRRSLTARLRQLEQRGLIESEWRVKRPPIPQDAVVFGLSSARAGDVSGEVTNFFAADRGGGTFARLARRFPGGRDALRDLMSAEIVDWEPVPDPNGVFASRDASPEPGIDRFGQDQRDAFASLTELIDKKKFAPALLWGPTGSGKTAVYCAAIRHTWEQGRNALYLVPEISLAAPMIARLRRTLGERVGVWHSGLTSAQRYWIARKVAQGYYRLLVGARSAIFAPIPDLGLIVVDEEHAESYKQSDPAPRYHARDVAVVRARQCQAVCLLGSATPSCESQQNAADGRYASLTLKRRATGRFMPLVRLVDLTGQHRCDQDSWITAELAQAIVKTIRAGDKAIVFLNRRGYATMVACKSCGHAATCPECSLTLTYHANDRSFRCHVCTHSVPAWERCPRCGSPDFLFRGAGTQKIEEKLAELDPGIRLARLDSDISAKRGAAEAVLAGFAGDEYNLLVGTQMVAKGLDVAKVGLVGVIWADQHMAFPDFRAEERTFQLLTQVAGRAGRGAGDAGIGEVIVQTYRPDHDLIELAAAQNADLFFQRELPRRKSLSYPPYSHLVLLSFAAEDPTKARGAAQSFADFWNDPNHDIKNANGCVLGPAPAAVPRRAGRHVFHILVKAMAVKKIWRVIDAFRMDGELRLRRSGVGLTIDVDPTDFW